MAQNKKNSKLQIIAIFFLWVPLAQALQNVKLNSSNFDSNNFLDASEAFSLKIFSSEGQKQLLWEIAPDYYLYSHGFNITWVKKLHSEKYKNQKKIKYQLNQGIRVYDEYFGTVEVFYNQAQIVLNLKKQLSDNEINSGYLIIEYQGCAEAGLCYPTQKQIWNMKKRNFTQ